jgi:Zn-dependent peptidase ImmA (M78 family)
MMVTIEVKPPLLVWARKTLGLQVAVAARKAQIKPQLLTDMESGSLTPSLSLAQAERLAKVYKRPLAALLLDTPPKEPRPLHDFRVHAGRLQADLSSQTLLAIRRARRLRRLLAELRPDRALQTKWSSIRSLQNPEDAACNFRRETGVSAEQQRNWPDYWAAFRAWRSVVENCGAVVFQFKLPDDDGIRGLSIPASSLPIVVLNSHDFIGARSFSLFHEVAHLMLGKDGLCDMVASNRHDRVEIFCNHFAGAVLVPAEALLANPIVGSSGLPREWTDSELSSLRTEFKVSEEVLLRRLLILDRTTQRFYERKRMEWIEKARAARTRSKEEKRRGGLVPWKQCVIERGPSFASAVLGAVSDGRITSREAADFLGVSPKHLDAVANEVVRALDR